VSTETYQFRHIILGLPVVRSLTSRPLCKGSGLAMRIPWEKQGRHGATYHLPGALWKVGAPDISPADTCWR